MAMMAKMRSLAPWFIITVGGIFILFMVMSDSKIMDITRQGANNVGEIDGEDISYQKYSHMVDSLKQEQIQSTGRDIDQSQMDQFKDQVWDMLVNQTLINHKIREFGIKVSDEEISDIIINNPPQFLVKNFVDSATGRFNKALYLQALKDPRNKAPLIKVEHMMRAQLLQMKLASYLGATVQVSDAELKQAYVDRTCRMVAQYAYIDASSVPDNQVGVTDEDMQKFYDNNKYLFKSEPQRRVKYVLFSKTATADDSAQVRNSLQQMLTKMKSDTASFKNYVLSYSDQPYSQDSLKVSSLSPQARAALAQASAGSIVGPVLTPEGYTVYKLINRVQGKDGELLVVEKINNKVEMSAGGQDELKQKAGDFAYLADKNDFYSEAHLMKYRILQTPPFTKDADAAYGSGITSSVLNFAFDNKVGKVSKVLSVPQGDIVAIVSAESKGGLADFNSVKPRLKALVLHKKKVAKAAEIANGIKSRIGGNLTLAKSLYPGIRIDTAKNFTTNGIIQGFGREFAFTEAAFKAVPGQITGAVKGKNGAFLIKLTSRQEFDSNAYNMQRKMFRDSLLQQKRQRFISDWIRAVRKSVKIVDNRYNFQ